MGVITVDEDGEVWSASSRFIHSMLEHFVRTTGEREYLVSFLKSFEHGYNSIRLNEIDVSRLEEFQKLVQIYINDHEYSAYGDTDADLKTIERNLQKLIDLIDLSLTRRRHSIV